MSRETKIGIFALAAILLLIFGYQFLKGKNVFTRSQTYYIRYDNINQLSKSDPVLLNGFQIGLVQDIYQDPDNLQKIIVMLNINPDVQVPDESVAEINTTSLMGGKAIILKLKGACCKKSGDFLSGTTEGMLNSMVGEENLKSYIEMMTTSIEILADTLISKISGNASIGKSGQNLEAIIENARITTQLVNTLLASDGPTFRSMNNISGITGNLKDSNPEIQATLENVNKITADLQAAQLSNTVAELNKTLTDLQGTLAGANTAIADIAAITDAIKTSQGTLGLLINDRELHDQLDQSLVELELLLEDIRLHPKRYTRILSKKEIEYEEPND